MPRVRRGRRAARRRAAAARGVARVRAPPGPAWSAWCSSRWSILLAVLAPVLAPAAPSTSPGSPRRSNHPPMAGYPLGTDPQGAQRPRDADLGRPGLAARRVRRDRGVDGHRHRRWAWLPATSPVRPRAVIMRVVDFFLVCPRWCWPSCSPASCSRGVWTIILAIGVTPGRDGPAGARPDPDRRGPPLHRAGVGAGRRPPPRHHPPRAARGAAAGAGQHHAHRRLGHHLRVHAVLPRPRRPDQALVGHDAQARPRLRRRHRRATGGSSCRRAWPSSGRAVLHPRRPCPGVGAQPHPAEVADERRPAVDDAPHLPGPTCGSPTQTSRR